MAECDITNNDLTTAFTSSSLDSENLMINNNDVGNKKRKTHRLKQRFQVVKKLGQGTYGKVQLAINNETGQEVAIKTIKKNKVSNQQDLVRIRREIQIMSSINHPNIIHIFEVFENKDKIVLVMQYANGGELYDYVSFHKALSDVEARRVFRQIATAIYYCHKNKICHRDLKLENILLDEKGNAKIADFGLSNVFDDKHFLQTFCGSPLYASPEIVRGLPYFGPEVDCWSLGVLLYTLVYGAMPFDGSNFKKLVKQISEANYAEPPEKSPASDLIHKLLTPEPKERASIIDICVDPWVNQDCEHSLLQVAEDMSNLTNHAVRLDMLLALAPGSQQNETKQDNNNQEKDKNNDNNDINNDNKTKIKRPNESNSANDSLVDVPKKTTKKKSKKNLSNEEIKTDEQEQQQLKEQEQPEKQQLNKIEETKLLNENKNDNEIINNNDDNQNKLNEIKSNESQTSLKSNDSTSSMKKRGKISIPKIWDDNNPQNNDNNVQSPKKGQISPGLFSVSELKKELEQRTIKNDSSKSSSIVLNNKRRGTIADTSELKQKQESLTSKDDDNNMKKYKNRSNSLNLNNIIIDKSNEKEKIKTPTSPVSSAIQNQQVETKSENEKTDRLISDGEKISDTTIPTSKTSSTSSINNDKSLAKQIIQKNIAKAKLMEKRQISTQSTTTTSGLQSGETTPLISIENSKISTLIKNDSNSSSASSLTNVFFRKNETENNKYSSSTATSTPTINNTLIINPAPISRSYKKVIFTKDGAKITETGKVYSHEGDDGFTTRVEKTSRITITNNGNNNSSSTILQRSDSQSSTGSLDIFDDIFDDHWTDNLFSNAKSLFNDFFGRRNEKLSLRSRAESLERTNYFPNRSNDNLMMKMERKFPMSNLFNDSKFNNNNSFGSNKSLFTKKSIFNTTSSSSSTSSFIKSSLNNNFFNDNDDDNNEDHFKSTRIDDLRKKYGLNRFSSDDDYFKNNKSIFNNNNNRSNNKIFDDYHHDQRKSRIEQWLDNNNNDDDDDFNEQKDFNNCMNKYGTIIRPTNRIRNNNSQTTMTSSSLTSLINSNNNDDNIENIKLNNKNVETDIIKRVEVTNTSATCQVIKHKKQIIKSDENIIPKDIKLNFKLDDQTGSLIINNLNIIPQKQQQQQQQQQQTSSTTVDNDLKIEEPSSLLEQLRTIGYKKLVDRRLSDSSSTEDLEKSSTTTIINNKSSETISTTKSNWK